MGIATQPPQLTACASRPHAGHIPPASMSQGYHQSIFSFSDGGGFDRSTGQEQQQQHIAQQSRRDKLRVQGFDAAGNPLVPIDEEGEEPPPGIYDSAPAGSSNMLSDLFSFPPAAGPSATELLASQMSAGGYRLPPRPSAAGGFSGDWYGGRQGIVLGGGGGSSLSSIGESTSKHHHDGGGAQLMGLNAAAMQLFLMNPAQPTPPPQRRSPSPPVPPPQAGPSGLHHHAQAFQSFGEAAFGGGGGGGGGLGEGKGLSLSLSSSLQQFDMTKADELRVREGVLYFNNQQQQQHPALHLQSHGQGQQVHMSYGTMGVVNVLRNSKYARAAQQLLEEFCSVGRGQSKGSKVGRQRGAGSSNPKPSGGTASSSAAASSSTSKPDAAPLSSADKFEYQRKKAKLISMLDEVDRRYNHYCDQMQMVVNSFDSVMGFGAAAPYTALAQKAMSRHFRCLKDAIAAQLKQTCELLGDKEGANSAGGGITKGETPRLRLIDQSLRQQRAFHQMGMMEQEAWRPQRGLPERSVTILRAWLFEHFLHPYPSDADKHLLARQTGLSRNQVSNWFINARVRLWKPMVEDMYQQEFKDGDDDDSEKPEGSQQQQHSPPPPPPLPQQQHQVRRVADTTTNAPPEGDPSASSTSVVSRHHYHHFASSSSSEPLPAAVPAAFAHHHGSDDSGILIPGGMAAAADMYRYGAAAAAARFGTAAAAGDVSLTLGLRHAGGNAAEKGQFSVRDFSA